MWKAVTTGTPSLSSLAVRPISASPPGAVASAMVAHGIPDSQASRAALPRQSAIRVQPLSSTPSRNRGAPRKKSGAKRAPSEQPINHWPRLTSQGGTDDSACPLEVRPAPSSSGPNSQPFGMPTRCAAPPASVLTASSAASGHGCSGTATGW